ncbi:MULTISPECIES: hypothetical protein [unclassified Streptomyces]|uniref:hypothetical protein n=1 Tax=unclassified Streptomyces TaxID=2593676 RepID=UPI00225AA4E1|nr:MULTISPECIES: hypothetical protein [unclassified Streptomyces]MCX5142295.1 hypothetical protein [Streptomyces sp. NBC_00338]WRZ66752.1 hypothetical protein OG408_24040 [Streptomyces sp. NBC_01257]WSU60761.1 hypothetical protein OG450_24300 [Streptomyces sp. NBC_01104]
MPTSEREVRPPRAVSMRDLLAAGAAATAVSTPPCGPRPRTAPVPRDGKPSGTGRA